MKVLLFQIYGNRRAYHLELTYSILSALRFLRDDTADIRIVLAADAPNQRPDLPVEHLLMTSEMLDEWQMGGTYHHAIKPNALHYAVRHFGAPVILIDSDTIFHAHPKRLFARVGPGRTLMNAKEGMLRNSLEWQDWEHVISESRGRLSGWPVGPETVMHNSGVLGLDPSDAPLMNEVNAVMRDIRAHSKVFTAEQLAASMVFGAGTEVSGCEDLVDHYWGGPRAYYQYQMARMFPQVLDGGGLKSVNMDLPPLRSIPPVRTVNRIAARLKQLQRGNDGAYGFAYLAYLSALSERRSDVDLANVWAATALDMLSFGLPIQHQETARDFTAFVPSELPDQTWMQPTLQDRWQSFWSR